MSNRVTLRLFHLGQMHEEVYESVLSAMQAAYYHIYVDEPAGTNRISYNASWPYAIRYEDKPLLSMLPPGQWRGYSSWEYVGDPDDHSLDEAVNEAQTWWTRTHTERAQASVKAKL